MRELTLEEVKEVQLALLKKTSEYCEKENMSCMLGGGTLLGAVRHKGYIPWDDDIDIMMRRPDYDHFISSFTDPAGDMKVYAYPKDKKYPFPYAKISLETTRLVEKIGNGISFDIGVNIDLFPIDGFEDNDKEVACRLQKIAHYRKLLDRKMYPVKKANSLGQKLYKALRNAWCNCVPTGYLLNRIAKLVQQCKYEGSRRAGASLGGYGQGEVCQKEWLEKTTRLEFEGDFFDVPIGYQFYLTNLYGDYMTLPPEEKRVTHHSFKAFWK